MPAPLPPPMGQRIADVLAEEIVSGRYDPGQPLREQELAARFEASRGPVREAFRILEKEHLVEILPWRGARVVRLSIIEMRNVFELRGALFALIARLAAVNGRDNELEAIECLVDEMAARVEQGSDPEGQSTVIGDRMMEICGNDRAAEMLKDLERQTRWRYATLDCMDDRQRRQILSTWRGMADALAARDPDTAESIAKRMIRQYQEIVLSALELEESGDGVGAARPTRSSSQSPDRRKA